MMADGTVIRKALLVSRRVVKAGAETLLILPPILTALKRRVRGGVVILAYHNVIPDDEPLTGAHGAHIRLRDFRWQMDLVQEHCQVVPLDSILDAPRDTGTYRASITFDDAYVGTLREALPELVGRDLPATVFVPSGLVGKGGFWWDELGVSGWEGERLPLVKLAGRTEAIRAWAAESGIQVRPQGPSQLAAGEDEIVRAGSLPGITFGVHTVDHVNLAELSENEVARELGKCRRWLDSRRLPLSQFVSYPYGLTSESVEAVVRDAGFSGGLTITGGVATTRHRNPFRMPRLMIPAGVSPRNFVLRLHGVISS